LTPILFKAKKFQLEALASLKLIRLDKMKKRGLLIAATGSGKTIFSALHIKENPNDQKILFVVHNRTIIKNAISDYKKILPNESIFESRNDIENDILHNRIIFTTQQSVRKILNKVPKDFFDLIIIDEAHRSAANEHKNIIDYFTPKFLLGMSATPERMNDEYSTFEIYHHCIIHELRIDEALEEKYIAPFQYFGISTDLEIKNFSIDESDAIADKILNDVKEHGFDGDKLRALVFVTVLEDVSKLVNALNKSFTDDIAIAIKNLDENTISEAIKRLEDRKSKIKFLVSVNKFNEGIDIPTVNMIIFLRNTESKTIFLQQLGRGLRKVDSKVTRVLDYIGNYKNNFIGLEALSGRHANREKMTRVMLGEAGLSRFIDIHLDEITKERIFKNLLSRTENEKNKNKITYIELYAKLGRIPTIDEFIKEYDLDFFLDCLQIEKCYYNF